MKSIADPKFQAVEAKKPRFPDPVVGEKGGPAGGAVGPRASNLSWMRLETKSLKELDSPASKTSASGGRRKGQARNLKMARTSPKASGSRARAQRRAEQRRDRCRPARLVGLSTIGGLEIRVPEGWQTAPGMLPIILGVSLFIMSGLLLVKAIRAGALRVSFSHELGESSLTRAGIALLLVGIYYFVLLNSFPSKWRRASTCWRCFGPFGRTGAWCHAWQPQSACRLASRCVSRAFFKSRCRAKAI